MNSFSLLANRNSTQKEASPMSRSVARLAVMQSVAVLPDRNAKYSCGGEARVPFQPREGRPIYCSACYAKMKEEA